MPRTVLEFKAESLENLSSVRVSPDARFYCKVTCTNCGEVSNTVYISAEEREEIPGSRGEANFVVKCKGCKRVNTVDVLKEFKPYSADNAGAFAPIAAFECRGAELSSYEPRAGFVAEGTKGHPFEVDLSESEWNDWDEAAGLSIGIYGVETRFVHGKK